MGKIRLFIENQEVELTEDIQFAITKQFSDLENPTTIINDWSKTVAIPFSQKNNKLFGDLYKEDRIIVDRENLANRFTHSTQYWGPYTIDWETNSASVFNSAPYFHLYGFRVKLNEYNSSGILINSTILNTYTSTGYYEGSYTINRVIGNIYKIIFELDSTPYNPGLVYEFTEDITSFSYSFDILSLDKINKQISFGNIFIVKGLTPENKNSNSIGLYFNPLKKLSFRLLNGDNVIMTGYAKTLSTTQNNGKGVYNITLNGELGKVFKELKEIKVQTNNEDSEYNWNTEDYIKFNMNKNTVYSSWSKSIHRDDPLDLHTRDEADYNLTDYIGFAPSNAKDEGFDYTMFQYDGDNTKTFEEELANHTVVDSEGNVHTFESETGMTAKDAISNGLMPREIGEFRSYLQTPFIMWNKFFQMFCKKVKDLTGYKCILDKTWFNNDNPYWAYLAMMLNKINIKDTQVYVNTYNLSMNPEHNNWNQNPGYNPSWDPWFTWEKQGTKYVIHNGKTSVATANIYPYEGSENTQMATYGVNGGWTIPLGGKVHINSDINITYKVKYTMPAGKHKRPLNYEDSDLNHRLGTSVQYATMGVRTSGSESFDYSYLNGRFPAELAAHDLGNVVGPGEKYSNKGMFEVTLNILNSNGDIVKSEKRYYFTKDTRFETPDIPKDYESEGVLIPEDNCYVEFSQDFNATNGDNLKAEYTFKIPVSFTSIVRDNELLDDRKFKISYNVRLLPKWNGAGHTTSSMAGGNTIGYIWFSTVSASAGAYPRVERSNYNFQNDLLSNASRRVPLENEQMYLREHDRTYFEFENGKTSVLFDVSAGDKRSGATIKLGDMWKNEVVPFDLILNYCKMFRIGIFTDEFNKTLTFKPFSTYFSNYKIEDWTDKVDKSKDYTVEPVSFASHNVLFNYEDSQTLLGKAYKTNFGFNYGEKNLVTQYEFDNSTTKLFDKIQSSIPYSDTILSWSDLYDNLKYNWRTIDDVYPYSLGDNKKYNSMFGQLFFYKATKPFENTGRQVKLSDDTLYQQLSEKYIYTQSSDSAKVINVNTYPLLDIYDFGIGGSTNYCLFNIPNKDYTTNYTGLSSKKGIYDNLWESYINELYNKNSKKVTCYIKISPTEYSNFEFNKFIVIDNTLFLVNKLFDYNMTDAVTKVELISVKDISAYSFNKFISNINSMEFINPNTLDSTIDLPANTFTYVKAFSSEYDISDNCMFINQDQLSNVETIIFNPSNEYTDEELGINIQIRHNNSIYIRGYKPVTVEEGESLTKTIYIINSAKSVSSITINRF